VLEKNEKWFPLKKKLLQELLQPVGIKESKLGEGVCLLKKKIE
jgi:hypothetical protein